MELCDRVGCLGLSLQDRGILRRLGRGILVGLSAALAAGCMQKGDWVAETYMADTVVIPKKRLKGAKKDYPTTGALSPEPIRLAKYEFSRGEFAGRPAIEVVASMRDQKRARDLRNQLVVELMMHSNKICEVHKARIIGRAASGNFGTGIAAVILSATASVIGTETAKTALTAAATVVTGGRAMMNQHFYANFLAPAILRQIDAGRRLVKEDIDGSWKKSIHSYPVEAAIHDLTRYHAKCSFYEGLVALTETDKEGIAKINRMSRAQIDKELCTLEKQNVGLLPTIEGGTTSVSKAASSAARTTFEYNRARISQLRIHRLTADGPIGQTCEEATEESNTPQVNLPTVESGGQAGSSGSSGGGSGG